MAVLLADTVWRPPLVTLGVLGLVGLWQIGRLSSALPAWAAPSNGPVDATVVITPGGIATALAHLGILERPWGVEPRPTHYE
jgi:hypothetical protein